MDEKKKFDCYNCKYRGEVPGSSHICCNHPSLGENSPEEEIMATFASVGRVAPVMKSCKGLNIRASSHGVANGWFNFPYNFDPLWLKNCDGYGPRG